MTDKNQYSLEMLQSRLDESVSLVEKVLIVCDFYENHVNLILIGENGDPAILSDYNVTPEQKLMYAMGITRVFDQEDENGACAIWGFIKNVYDLRSQLIRLNTNDLDNKIRKLIAEQAQGHPGWDEIESSNNTMRLWDRFNLGIASYVTGFTECYLKNSKE